MTNGEIAFTCVPRSIPQDLRVQIVAQIEQTINVAEKRGYEKCRAEATENGKELIKEAQRRGALQMREKAILLCEENKWGEHDASNKECRKCNSFCCGCENCSCHTDPEYVATLIRALPLIEGESK